MILRTAQVEAIAAAAETSFIQDLAKKVRSGHAEAAGNLDDAELERRLRIGVARARSHGARLQSALGLFVALMFEIGPNFDQHPAIRDALRSGPEQPDDRVLTLPDRVSEPHWVEAQERADASAWQERGA